MGQRQLTFNLGLIINVLPKLSDFADMMFLHDTILRLHAATC